MIKMGLFCDASVRTMTKPISAYDLYPTWKQLSHWVFLVCMQRSSPVITRSRHYHASTENADLGLLSAEAMRGRDEMEVIMATGTTKVKKMDDNGRKRICDEGPWRAATECMEKSEKESSHSRKWNEPCVRECEKSLAKDTKRQESKNKLQWPWMQDE